MRFAFTGAMIASILLTLPLTAGETCRFDLWLDQYCDLTFPTVGGAPVLEGKVENSSTEPLGAPSAEAFSPAAAADPAAPPEADFSAEAADAPADADAPAEAGYSDFASAEDGPPILATRIFSGPSQHPPNDFSAYGVVAFRQIATPSDRPRHIMICEAYVATLPSVSDVDTPRIDQMVTVWPVATDTMGERLTKEPPDNPCEDAVDHYGRLKGLRDIAIAAQTGVRFGDRRGPYLLAWSPGDQHGQINTSILQVDMSGVTTYDQAARVFRRWVNDIEQNPDVWRDGWSVEKLRVILQVWADELGEKILRF